jgi:hypothetical protein
VSYSSHLFRAACEDVRRWLRRQKAHGGVLAILFFLGGTTLAWLMRGSEVELVAPLLWGLGAVVLWAVGVFAMHWGYLTPRRLCAGKQHQIEAERGKFIAALDKERQATQFAQAERDVLKTKLEARPLRPLELREEIDQLLAEGDTLLATEESTAIMGEAELWLDDVERFAKRHLSPEQYDHLHTVEPPDLEEQVLHHRVHSEEAAVAQEEIAVVERLVRTNAGLKELRQMIRG